MDSILGNVEKEQVIDFQALLSDFNVSVRVSKSSQLIKPSQGRFNYAFLNPVRVPSKKVKNRYKQVSISDLINIIMGGVLNARALSLSYVNENIE